MKRKKYLPSGEGFFYQKGDPSRGVYGISPEIQEERNKEFQDNLSIEKYSIMKRVSKASELINEGGSSVIHKISLLKKLGIQNVKIRGGFVSLDCILEENYPNLHKAYESTINELRKIVKNPYKKSTLADRLDSME